MAIPEWMEEKFSEYNVGPTSILKNKSPTRPSKSPKKENPKEEEKSEENKDPNSGL